MVHLDLKSAPGVDIAGDFADPETRQRLGEYKFASTFCSNILEHVEDREQVSNAILSLLPEGGFIFVSCPYSYPYHPDPIDTMYRPNVDELARLFPGTETVRGEIIPCGTYARDIFRSPLSFVRWIGRLTLPFYKPAGWKAAIGNLRWLFRNFEATCIVLRVDARKQAGL